MLVDPAFVECMADAAIMSNGSGLIDLALFVIGLHPILGVRLPLLDPKENRCSHFAAVSVIHLLIHLMAPSVVLLFSLGLSIMIMMHIKRYGNHIFNQMSLCSLPVIHRIAQG